MLLAQEPNTFACKIKLCVSWDHLLPGACNGVKIRGNQNRRQSCIINSNLKSLGLTCLFAFPKTMTTMCNPRWKKSLKAGGSWWEEDRFQQQEWCISAREKYTWRSLSQVKRCARCFRNITCIWCQKYLGINTDASPRIHGSLPKGSPEVGYWLCEASSTVLRHNSSHAGKFNFLCGVMIWRYASSA